MSIFTVLHTLITGISQYLSCLATSVGFSVSIGAMMMSFAMIGNILTRLVISIISDILFSIRVAIVMILINISALVLLLIGTNLILLLSSSSVFGSIYSV